MGILWWFLPDLDVKERRLQRSRSSSSKQRLTSPWRSEEEDAFPWFDRFWLLLDYAQHNRLLDRLFYAI